MINASREVASWLDPDHDDDIPLETITTFCRLSRLSLLIEADRKKAATTTRARSALIICDMQNDLLATSSPCNVYTFLASDGFYINMLMYMIQHSKDMEAILNDIKRLRNDVDFVCSRIYSNAPLFVFVARLST